MAEWMENVEKAIARIMADKVYTSAEFKRERDNFHALCKDLERSEVKKWLHQILEILMAERPKSWLTCTGSATPTVTSLSPILSSLTASCFPPPATLLPPAWRMSMSSSRGRRSPLSSSTPREMSLRT